MFLFGSIVGNTFLSLISFIGFHRLLYITLNLRVFPQRLLDLLAFMSIPPSPAQPHVLPALPLEDLQNGKALEIRVAFDDRDLIEHLED